MHQRATREFIASAEAAGLQYVTDSEPGIRRRRVGRGFSYVDSDGRVIREREHIAAFARW
jgi:DNA topoisomerase-1